MDRYKIFFDKTINQLTPWFIGGRKLILYIQSLIKPLQSVNNIFSNWAMETRIEASMTSQVIKLQWFLDRKFSQYFLSKDLNFTIKDGSNFGSAIYNENADIPIEDNLLLKYESENEGVINAERWVSSKAPYLQNSIVNVRGKYYMSLKETYNPPLPILKYNNGNYIKKRDGGYMLAGSPSSSENIDEDWILVAISSEEGETANTACLYFQNENIDIAQYSFIVYAPAIDTSLIDYDTYLAMIKYQIDKYKVSGKSYLIKVLYND